MSRITVIIIILHALWLEEIVEVEESSAKWRPPTGPGPCRCYVRMGRTRSDPSNVTVPIEYDQVAWLSFSLSLESHVTLILSLVVCVCVCVVRHVTKSLPSQPLVVVVIFNYILPCFFGPLLRPFFLANIMNPSTDSIIIFIPISSTTLSFSSFCSFAKVS